MLSGFKQFVLRGNVVDMAVGVVIGVAFATVVSEVCQLFCVNGRFSCWFLGMGCWGRGPFPLPQLQLYRSVMRVMTQPAPGPASDPAIES
jgi:Large-conductance mechanosensitive channel, MscL